MRTPLPTSEVLSSESSGLWPGPTAPWILCCATLALGFLGIATGALAGEIQGSLTDDADGVPIGDATVIAQDASGAIFGQDLTAADGTYAITGLDDGSYYVYGRGDGYVAQYHPAAECVGDGFCDPLIGTPVVVSDDAPALGIDLSLRQYLLPQGTLWDPVAKAPVAGLRVTMSRIDGAGAYRTPNGTAADGRFQLAVAPGDYWLLALGPEAVEGTWETTLYPDAPCPLGAPDAAGVGAAAEDCDVDNGEIVMMVSGETPMDRDILVRRRGRAAGTVILAGSGIPPAGPMTLTLLDEDGLTTQLPLTLTPDGAFSTGGLRGGSYRAWVDADPASTLPQLYNGHTCQPGVTCDPATEGDAVPIAAEQLTDGLEFHLEPPAALDGTMRQADSGTPASAQSVQALRLTDESVATTASSTLDGSFELRPLAPDRYRIGTLFGGGQILFLPGVTCPDGATLPWPCPGPAPSTIALHTPGQRQGGFTLPLLAPSTTLFGYIGRTLDLPITGLEIDVWDHATGVFVASATSSITGFFQLDLPTGTYAVSTDGASTTVGAAAIDRIFPEVLCPQGSARDGLCDPTAGAPLVIDGTSLRSATFLFGEPLFADDLESGGAGSWTTVVGAGP